MVTSVQQLLARFPELRDWNRDPEANEDVLKDALRQVAALKPGRELYDKWTLEETLEAIGCTVAGTSAFNKWCEENALYDVWTLEYVNLLARRLVNRRVVLEVGAGDGRLSHLLKKQLELLGSHNTQVIATDSGTWRIPNRSPINIVKMDYQRAVEVYKPDVIIQAWMPMGLDFTHAFRKHPKVKEYILIGEADEFGCCGHAFLTWGKKTSLPVQVKPLDVFDWLSRASSNAPPPSINAPALDQKTDDTSIAPYLRDGFVRQDLHDLSRLQYSRYDRRLKSGNSKTVAFVRK